MEDIQLTVLIATRNGGLALRRTLNSWLAVAAPSVGWELIVVDNGSTDDTLEVLGSYRARLPLRVLSEPIPSKNRALNVGLEARRGQLVIFTDDDALPDRGFLRAWEPLLNSQSEFDLFGGRIRPSFEQPPPAWLLASPDEYAMMFGERILTEGEVAAGEFYGANMAVRSRVFDAGHRLDEAIGPNGADPNYPMGSETEFCFRLSRQTGARSYFVPEALVEHIVHPHQWTMQAWKRRSFRGGRGRAYIMHAHNKPVRRPSITFFDLLRIMSPSRRARFKAIRAVYLRRGFDAEVRRWRRLRPRNS